MPLTSESLPLLVLESNNDRRPNTLRVVKIKNLPVSSVEHPISYVLNTELGGKIFSTAPGYANVEKVLFILTKRYLYAVLVEMKTSITPSVIRKTEKKIQDSLGRIALFLSYYVFDDHRYDNCEIKFATIILYNNDWLTEEIVKKSDRSLESLDLVKVFQNKTSHCYFTEPLGQEFKVEITFIKNPVDSDEIELDLFNVFEKDTNFSNAIFDNFTFPQAANIS